MVDNESTRTAINSAIVRALALSSKEPFAEYSELIQLLRAADKFLTMGELNSLQAIYQRLGQLNARSLGDLDVELELCVLQVQVSIRELILGSQI
jgi:hypothetical protein